MGTGRLPIAQLSRDGKRKKGAQPPPSQPNPAIINSPSPLLSATHRITTLRNLQNHLNDHIYAIPHSHLQTSLSVISTHRFPFDTPPSPTTNHQPPTITMAETHTYEFNVTMSCGGCSGAIDRVLKKLDGMLTSPLPAQTALHPYSAMHAAASIQELTLPRV
jgi:copper chaperone CopZ